MLCFRIAEERRIILHGSCIMADAFYDKGAIDFREADDGEHGGGSKG